MALPLILIWVLLLLLNLADSKLDEFYYSGFSGVGSDNISLNGVATIQPNGILRLTNDTSRLIGHAFYPSQLQFKNSTNSSALSFSTCFVIAIVPEYPKLGGHGMAFTISPSKELPGALPSQYLGLLNNSDIGNFSNHIFAVEFDTVQDFEFKDVNDNHIGVDLNNLASNSSTPATWIDDSGTKRDLNLKSGNRVQAWIDYDGVEKLLTVSLSPSSNKPRSPILSYGVDLSPFLENSMYVGFSASTGLLASSHYLFGWSFKMGGGAARSLDLSALPDLPHHTKKNTALIAAASISAVLAMVLFLSAAVYLFRKIKNADVIEPWELEYGPHRFSYKELKTATRGFREKELLGFGGFGRVYRGTLPGSSRTQVAVKRVSQQSKQGIREFVAEIASIGRLRHRNLVQLQGWCRRREDLLLVYDYMSNGSLDKYLFDEPKSILSWPQRFKIIKGVASGLLYLHEEWEQVVIHRDVKASNVLLDSDMNGRLGDFGLARLYEHGSNPNTTHVVGTLGYLAPELTRTGKATTSTDVFAFGAVLLEVVSGRRPIEPKAMPEEMVLVDFVWEKWGQGRLMDVADPRMGEDYRVEEVEIVLKLGLSCSHPNAGERPSMREVVRYLDGEGGPLDVAKSQPLDYDGERGSLGFDDFVHSYPSSTMEKVEEEYCFAVGTDGDLPSTSSFSLLSLGRELKEGRD